MDGKCLFSAPFDFLPKDILAAYESFIPTVFREIWVKDQLTTNELTTAWVMNPGQNFVVNGSVLDYFPNIEVLSTPSTGTNHIDIVECKKRNIKVYSLLDNREILDSISASAEFSFLLLLNTLRRLDFAINEAASGRWRDREERMRGYELAGKQVGLVGFGRIGQRLSRWSESFDAQVSFYDPYVKSNDTNAKPNSLELVFSESDIICICCALTDETRGMIDYSLLNKLKPNASLINTSRGEILVEADLATILKKRADLRVGLDVISGEVKGEQYNSPLIRYLIRGQIVITPHIAGATIESQSKAAIGALSALRKHFLGE